MELLFVLLALGVLWFWCAFFTLKCRLHSALAPLCSLSVLVTWLTVCGMADFLVPGMIIAWAGGVALGLWALATKKPEGTLATAENAPKAQRLCGRLLSYRRAFCTPGAVLFWGLSLAFAIYFFVRKPMSTGFDELQLWSTAVKLTKTDGRLYTMAQVTWPWQATQDPGLSLLSYFFEFLGSYADWKIYLAYNVLSFSVFAAVLGGVRWNQYRLAVPLAAVCWCVPWFFTTYNHTIYLNTVYMTAYGDIPAGLVMGGAVALWLQLRHTDGPHWAVLPVLALCANIKSNTFVLSLVAAGLVAVDSWLFPQQKPFSKGLLRRTGFAVACLAVPLAVSRLWGRYIAGLVAANAAAGGMGQTSEDPATVAVYGIQMLLGRAVPEFYESRRGQFFTAMHDMGAQYWTSAGRLSMIGQGCVVTVLILVLFFGAWLVAGQRGLRWRTVVTAALSLLCFGGYNLMLALSYGFIFKPFQAESLVDYNRYIDSYYIGWFLIALALVSLALQPGQQADCEAKAAGAWPERRAVWPLLGQTAVLLLAVGMLWRVGQMVLPQLSVLGFSDGEFADRRLQQARAEQVMQYISEQDRVFYVSQGDNGLDWFTACYDFYPVLVDVSGDISDGGAGGCGGTFGLPELVPLQEGAKQYYYHPYTQAEFDALVRKSGCSVLYLDKVDDIFVKSYGALFTDELAGALAGTIDLYYVTPQGFAPFVMKEAPLQ